MNRSRWQTDPRTGKPRRATHRIAALGLVLGLLAVLVLMGAGLGYRGHFWSLGSAFSLLRWAAYVGIVAVVVSLSGGLLALRAGRRGALLPALIGLACGVIAAGLPWSWLQQAKTVPPIHDVSTDTAHPPKFVAILARRAKARYGGPEVAAQQHAAYSDIRPISLTVAPKKAFQAALASAKTLGWQIAAAVPGQGRIEATDTTLWFGFKDDIVIRIRPAAGGSQVDVRSVSRIGKSDVGKNAARIRAFRSKLNERLSSSH